MRYLILSDMHSNWDALEAVLRRTRRKRFDAVLVLGDLVGYGGAPNQVVDAVRNLPGKVHVIRGNHDKVVAGINGGAGFNPTALAAALWTSQTLTPANRRYVRDLAPGPVEVEPGLTICHGSPLDEDAYVFSEYDAYEVFADYPAPLVFFGHTHIPSLFVLRDDVLELGVLRGKAGSVTLDADARYLINPGSIGQPRDRDPRAAFMTYDSRRHIVRWYRVDYPIEKAQRRILKAGLPKILADRLALGV